MKDSTLPLGTRKDADRRYSQIPWLVLTDKGLRATDVRLYAALASHAFRGDTVSFTRRWVEESIGLKAERVKDHLERLVAHGHIEQLPKVSGRSVYRLLSPVFAEKAKVTVSDKKGTRTVKGRSAAMSAYRSCKLCGSRSNVGATGVCALCAVRGERYMAG